MALFSDKIVLRGKPKETSEIGEAPAYRHSEAFQNREPKESAWQSVSRLQLLPQMNTVIQTKVPFRWS